MARDYKKESEWMKKKYVRLQGYIDAELGTQFKAKLKQENMPYAEWLRARIKEYLGET